MIKFLWGTFRVRGENLEIFPSHLEDRAWRISLNLNKLERLEEFDPLTGDKTNNFSIIKLYANSHYITPKPTIDQAIKEIRNELEITLQKHESENKLLEAQRLRERTKFDWEMIEAYDFWNWKLLKIFISKKPVNRLQRCLSIFLTIQLFLYWKPCNSATT